MRDKMGRIAVSAVKASPLTFLDVTWQKSGNKYRIMLTCPCNVDPLTSHFFIVKLRVIGVYLLFLIFALKHRLWVLLRIKAVLTCTYNLCFEQK